MPSAPVLGCCEAIARFAGRRTEITERLSLYRTAPARIRMLGLI